MYEKIISERQYLLQCSLEHCCTPSCSSRHSHSGLHTSTVNPKRNYIELFYSFLRYHTPEMQCPLFRMQSTFLCHTSTLWVHLKQNQRNLNCFLYKINALFVTIFYSLTNFFIRNAKTEAEKKKIDLTI